MALTWGFPVVHLAAAGPYLLAGPAAEPDRTVSEVGSPDWEADRAAVQVEVEDAVCLAHEPGDRRAASARPPGRHREVPVDGVDAGTRRVVVELKAVRKAPHPAHLANPRPPTSPVISHVFGTNSPHSARHARAFRRYARKRVVGEGCPK